MCHTALGSVDWSNVSSSVVGTKWFKHDGTVKPACNDHLYNKIYYLWFIQWSVLMMTEGTN